MVRRWLRTEASTWRSLDPFAKMVFVTFAMFIGAVIFLAAVLGNGGLK
jgi:hypothetical protein